MGQGTTRNIDSLANTIGMEFVYGDRVPIVNAFGYYGATAVFGFALTEKWSGLFLFRKLYDPSRSRKHPLDLFNDYDYSLVFYWRDKAGELQHKVLPVSCSLVGMSLYYGNTNFDLAKFKYLDNGKEFGTRMKADYSNGCLPIVISGSTVTRVLYYYKGKWLERTERFD